MADLTGQTLGQYTIGDLIGRGGMAHVYRAHQPSMDRDVAIKVMATELTSNPEFVARFEREARVIARLQHPHVLPVIDFGRSGEHVYLVMRLITGGVLSERMINAPLTIRQTERLLSQIASALEYAHRNSVIHRDLKPTNVLLDEQDNAYLTDFGIAKMLAGSTSNYSLTATGRVMGTPAYMAPEQWRSDPVDARTDIYALGVILYEMLLGALPFNSETPYGMMYKHFDTPPPAPRAVNPNLPDALEYVVLHALAKYPGDRYPSAQVMADEFSGAVRSLPPEVLAQPLPRASIEEIERATPPSQRQQASAPPGAETAQSGYYAPAFADPHAATSTQANRGGTPTLARGGAGRRRGGIVIAGIALLLITVAAIIGILTLLSGDDRGDDASNIVGGDFVTLDATMTETYGAIMVITTPQNSDTPAATETAVEIAAEPSGTPTDPPSDTPLPTATTTDIPTETATATLTATATATDTLIPSETPDLDATASALVAERLTQTATSWTNTPTPDIEASVIAAMTGTAEQWTATPSATYTITPSPTERNTLPPPPTSTPVPSRTPLPTFTPTRTPTRTPFPTWTPFPTATASCNTLPARMEVGEGGRTTLFPDEMTHIRRSPGTSQLIVHAIPPGLMFDVVGGPQCANGILWWFVEGYDASGRWSGWIGEGRSGEYWIEPFETGGLVCPGSLPPRLIPGETGRVKLYPASPNRVRSAPTTSQNNTVGQIQPGEEFDVISGPFCDEDNHWRWWFVRKGALTGWTAEGEPGTYWLEPMP